MAEIESHWPKYPDYRIERVPFEATVRVWHGDLLLAETDGAVRLTETDHLDRVYVPHDDVRWEHFARNDHHTICPYKGEASYWTLTATDPPVGDLIWDYPEPFDEVAGLDAYVGVYHERLGVEVDEPWPGDAPGERRGRRFPAWGTAADLCSLMDVQQVGPGRFTAPARPVFVPKYGPAPTQRNVVEGGQLLGASIVAAARTVTDKRVVHASAVFVRPASFDVPIDVEVEVLHDGRTFATILTRLTQANKLCSTATVLLDTGSAGSIGYDAPMPDVPSPEDSARLDMAVVGRELRVVDAAYDPDPDRIGPPEIDVWCRFAEAPEDLALRQALLAQSITHWTIAAGMRPHPGVGEADAHLTLSTGVLTASIAFHGEAEIDRWHLYRTRSPHAGGGLVHGDGIIFGPGQSVAASYSVEAMVRPFATPPASLGLDASTAM